MALWHALYQCVQCLNTWGHASRPTQCPLCGSAYLKWTNFAELRDQTPWYKDYPK